MPVQIRKTRKVRRLVNPARRKKSSASRRRATAKRRTHPRPRTKARKPPARKAKRNPGPAVMTLGYLNPKGGSMTRKRKTRRPGVHKIRRRRNSAHSRRVTARATDMLKTGAYALGGLVITRQVPQAVLGGKNSGLLGYIVNIVTAIAAAAAVGKIGGKQAGQAVGIGGALYTVERILNEQLTPLGKALSLSGVGDAQAHGGMGAIKHAYFPWPVVTGPNGPVIPREITDAAVAAIPAAQPATASLGRFVGRF